MESFSTQSFGLLAERAGLRLALADAEVLRSLFEHYLARLEVLYAADLGDEEVSGRFLPDQGLE